MNHINTKLYDQAPAFLITLIFILFILAQGAKAACSYENYLSAEELPVGIIINWSTNEEIDNELFVIEKSEDGINYSKLGTVRGAGNSIQVNDYSFMDVNVSSNINYYRLKNINSEGLGEYSESIRLEKEMENNFNISSLSSEIVKNEYRIKVDALVAEKINCVIRNAKGKEVFNENQKLSPGSNNILLDFSGFKPGIYKVHLKMKAEEEILVLRKITSPQKNMASMTSKK